MKVLLFGQNAQNIKDLVEKSGLIIVDQSPDAVISYGGDGTLLSAERKYPGIPKLPIRDSKTCKKCPAHTTEALLKALAEGLLNFKYFPKLEAKTELADILAINDIVIRNITPMH